MLASRTAQIVPRSARPISSQAAKTSSILTQESQHSRYTSLTVVNLRSELQRRDLKKTGRREELLERLAAYDVLHSSQARSLATSVKSAARAASASASSSAASARTRDYSPPLIPKPFELEPRTQLKVRVPYLPDSDFARYHRHEYVAQVATPLSPRISTASGESTYFGAPSATLGSEDLEVSIEDAIRSASRSGANVVITTGERSKNAVKRAMNALDDLWPKQELKGRNLFSPPVDEGQKMTPEKESYMIAFAAVAALWWVVGGSVMGV